MTKYSDIYRFFDEYMLEQDTCNICGEKITVEFNDFSTGFVDRYSSYCGCTKKEEGERLAGQRTRYTDSFTQPTIGDLLRDKRESFQDEDD